MEKGGRSERDKLGRRRSTKLIVPPSSDARPLYSLSHRSSSSVYSTILSRGSISDSWYLSSYRSRVARCDNHLSLPVHEARRVPHYGCVTQCIECRWLAIKTDSGSNLTEHLPPRTSIYPSKSPSRTLPPVRVSDKGYDNLYFTANGSR